MTQGYIYDEAEIDRVSGELSKDGTLAFGAAANESGLPEWDGSPVMLFDAEVPLFGKHLDPFSQRRGTCVARGTTGAIEDSLFWSVNNGLIISEPHRIAWEPTYIHGRVVSAKNRWRGGDGMAGANGAQSVHDVGVLRVGAAPELVGDEQWACDLANGKGLPDRITALMGRHRIRTFKADDISDLPRAIANGCGVAICMQKMVDNPNGGNNRDADGMCRPKWSGGHCTRLRGVYKDHRDRLCFVHGQSWGKNIPGGPNMIKTNEGRIKLPPGCCGVFADDIEPLIFQRGAAGEAWAFQFRDDEGFRPSKLMAGDLIDRRATT